MDEIRKFTLEFIQVYRSLPALYAVNHPDYNNSLERAKCYSVLLKKCREQSPNFTLDDAHKKLNILRTNYRRQRAKIIQSGDSSKAPTLWYYDAMSFLDEPYEASDETKDKNVSLGVDANHKRNNRGVFEEFKEEEQIFILDLIDLYRSFPALYAPEHKHYQDRQKRDEAYQILLDKYKERFPEAGKDNVRRKLNILRTSYRREQQKFKQSGGTESSKWFYYEAMSFLDRPLVEPIVKFEKTEEYEEYEIPKTSFDCAQFGERQFILEFLKVYRSLPALYDSTSPNYQKPVEREEAYTILLRKYREKYPQATILDVGRKLNTLCSNYRSEKLRLEKSSGSDESKRLWYYDAISFVDQNGQTSNELEEDFNEDEIPEHTLIFSPYLCRLCLTNCSEEDANIEDFAGTYERLMGFIVRDTDIPRKICINCSSLISQLASFTEICYKTESILKETQNTMDCVKVEPNDDDYLMDENDTIEEYKPIIPSVVVENVEENQFFCSLCKDKSYKFKSGLSKHMKRVHLNLAAKDYARGVLEKKLFQCNTCLKLFRGKVRLKEHFKTHDSQFKEIDKLSEHQQSLHTINENEICHICGCCFPTVEGLNQHMNTHEEKTQPVHTIIENEICHICGCCFPTVKGLIQHMDTHKEKAFGCPVCHMKFVVEGSLRKHMSLNHQGFDTIRDVVIRNVDLISFVQ